jgi:hypothetical protein
MQTRTYILLPIATCLAVAGCSLFDRGFEVTGMVRSAPGCWMIRAEDARAFEPTNLPAEFRKDSLRVRVTVEVRNDLESICGTGQIVDILRIQRQ